MKLIKTIQRLVEEAERDYYSACDRCADERTLNRLEKNYLDTLDLMKKVNKIDKDKKKKN
jgi:hypothetical protein